MTADRMLTFQRLGSLGRLGNQLFQVAATIGAARKNECDYVFPPWRHGQLFQTPPRQSTLAIRQVRPYVEQGFHYQDIVVSEPTALMGYFQSEKYFGHCAEEIRRVFTPRAELSQEMETAFGRLPDGNTCSVHVRRTDYVRNPNLFDPTSTDYYEKAISRIDRDATFLFFSDDIAWCKERFRDRRFVFIEGLTDFADMLLMSRCKAHIVANSSFSWWGAWLDANPNKIVIAPAKWFAGKYADPAVPFKPGPPHRGYHDTRDLIPAGWIRF
jgi:hypothetical protein